MGIAVRHLRKSFGSFQALDDVSVDVPDGSLTALLGPSGSGKSTLLRVIAGLEEPDSGEVIIGDQLATDLPPQRRNVGFVFQHYAAFKHMTVRDNVGFGLRIRWRSNHGCSCSTSRSARWTRGCVRSCVTGCAACTTKSTSPPSW